MGHHEYGELAELPKDGNVAGLNLHFAFSNRSFDTSGIIRVDAYLLECEATYSGRSLSTLWRNVSKLLPDYTASCRRRQYSLTQFHIKSYQQSDTSKNVLFSSLFVVIQPISIEVTNVSWLYLMIFLLWCKKLKG